MINIDSTNELQEVAHMAAIREAKAVQVRDTDTRTFILHPSIRSHLTTKLLVYCPWVYLFSELVGHRAAEDDFAGPATGLRFRLDRHADVEAALDPCGLLKDRTYVFIA